MIFVVRGVVLKYFSSFVINILSIFISFFKKNVKNSGILLQFLYIFIRYSLLYFPQFLNFSYFLIFLYSFSWQSISVLAIYFLLFFVFIFFKILALFLLFFCLKVFIQQQGRFVRFKDFYFLVQFLSRIFSHFPIFKNFYFI